MKFNNLLLSILLLTLLIFTPPAASGARDKYIPGEILVQIKPDKEAGFEKTVKKHNLKTKKAIKEIGYRLIKLPGKMTIDEALGKLKADPSVVYAGLNHTIHVTADPPQKWPNDPVFFYGDELLGVPQWGLYNDGSNQGWAGKYRADIHAPEAWYITTGSPNVIIANLDTGVDYNHEDLWEKVLTGYNAIDGSSDTMDYHSHGTFTAGVSAASSDNWTGVTGVAWDSPILPVKVIGDDGQGTEADGAEGIIWAANHGAKVLNMSFATDLDVPALKDAINYAWQRGCVLIAASGNEDVGFNMYPAAYERVIAVGASNLRDKRCTAADWGEGGSNYGPYLDVLAPGDWITSTYIDPDWGMFDYYPSSGTSAAAPFVSGIAALVLSIHPNWTNQQVFDQIVYTADDVESTGWDMYSGWGRANAYRALTETVNAVTSSIGLLRGMNDGHYVKLLGKVITAGSGQISNKAYIEEPDRSSGIMVYCPSGVPFGLISGDKVEVTASLGKVSGERALVGATLKETSSGTALRPVGITNRQCSGPAGEMLQGMFVKVWGRVITAGWDYMYIDDGSGLDDGSGYPGIKIPVPGMTLPAEGKIVSVVGALGMDIPQGASTAIPVVRPRIPGDIKILR